MYLYKLDLKSTLKNKLKRKKINSEIYLQLIMNLSYNLLNLTNFSENRELNKKIKLIENYIKENYNLDINIKILLEKIISNLRIDSEMNYIYLSEDSRFRNIKLNILVKILNFGTSFSPRINIIRDYLSLSVKLLNKKLKYK